MAMVSILNIIGLLENVSETYSVSTILYRCVLSERGQFMIRNHDMHLLFGLCYFNRALSSLDIDSVKIKQ